MTQSNLALLQSLLAAGAADDWQGVTSCVASDFVICEPDPLPYGGKHHGPDGFRNMIEIFQKTWTDLTFEIEVMGEIGDSVIMKGLLRAHSAATGKYVEASVAEFFTARDGKLVSSEVFYANEAVVVRALTPAPLPS